MTFLKNALITLALVAVGVALIFRVEAIKNIVVGE